MNIISNDNKKPVKFSNYDENNIRMAIKFLLEKKYDLNVHDQYALFLQMCNVKLLKTEFLTYRQKILQQLRRNFDQDNINMEYHITTKLPNIHLKIADEITETFFYFTERFKEETRKDYPNDYLLKMFTELMLDVSLVAAKYNVGPPILFYFKQKMKLAETQNKAISLKTFDTVNINKYTNNLSKQDSLINDKSTTGISLPDVTSKPQGEQSGTDGGSVRLPDLNQGQHIQTGTTEPDSKGGLQDSQQGGSITETEEIF